MNPTFKNRQNELITTTDGRKLFHSRSVAVLGVFVCVLKSDGKAYFAIEKRGNNPGLDKKGLWCLPCGYLDWDESGYDAMVREAWEEIGLDVRSMNYFILSRHNAHQPWFVNSNPDTNRQNVTLRYGVTFAADKLPTLTPNNDCEPDEVADAKWITVDEIKNYEFAFNHNEVILSYLDFTKNI